MPPIQSPPVRKLSIASARRIALAAQGFGRPRPARPPSVNQIAALVERLGLLQLDSVNVFCRAHYMPVFSRLGPYDRARLDRIAGHGTGQDRPPADRVLGARGVADPGRAAPAVPLADGGRRSGGVGLDLEDRARPAGAGRRDARARRRAGADPRAGHRRRPAAAAARPHVELARGQGRARVPVLHRAGGGGQAGQLRAAVRHDRARRSRPRSSTQPTPTRRTRSASWCGSPPARSASPPSPTSATTSGCRGPTRRPASRSWSPRAS